MSNLDISAKPAILRIEETVDANTFTFTERTKANVDYGSA